MIPVSSGEEQRVLMKLRREGRIDRPWPDSLEGMILPKLVEKGHAYDNGNGVFLPVERTLKIHGRDFYREVSDYLYFLHLDDGLLISREFDSTFYPWDEIHHWETIDTPRVS